MNRLAQEKSAYLRHAADQKIDWQPWSEEAFEKAQTRRQTCILKFRRYLVSLVPCYGKGIF